MRIAKLLGLFASLIVALACATGASAQVLERGEIHGTTYDASHAVVPKSTVTLSSPSTGYTRTIPSDDNGAFVFHEVLPGEYTLTAEAPNLAKTTVKGIELHVGEVLSVDVTMPLKTQSATVTVKAEAATETPAAGITQLLNSLSVSNLPFPGRDYRDLAQLTPSAQVVPGLRGGIRLGGQQSDYSGLVIDGSDTTNNFFGENFGSLETKNLTIPLEAVQEFQVVTNGFAPEFGRATGGLLNVVTKSGTNEVHGEGHEYYRGGRLTADDALHFPSNIDNQNQFGGSIGFPIHKDRQFLFLSTDIQRENGPLATNFCIGSTDPNCQSELAAAQGPIIPANNKPQSDHLPLSCASNAVGQHLLPACYGVPNIAAFETTSNQFQNFFTLLGHYDYQLSPANHFSIRGFGTRNHTSGFTGGRGQNEIQAAFNNTEVFVNQGISGVFALTTALGRKVNEIRVGVQGETRKRHPNTKSNVPEIQINGVANFGPRFFLPINNDNGKLQAQDNFGYSFSKHDIKFGGDVDVFTDRKDAFVGWSQGEYNFGTLKDFETANISDTGGFFFQGFGLNGLNVFQANTLFPNYQTGLGLYWQDKWQVTPRFTLTYGLRWDGTWNPQPQTPIPGLKVFVGAGAGSHLAPVPQRTPNDFMQWGPRVGFSWNVAGTQHSTIVRAAWGLYYAQMPTIFFPQTSNGGGSKSGTLFCPPIFVCVPPDGFPYLFPNTLNVGVTDLCTLIAPAIGCPSNEYADPSLRNPRVSNLTVGVEHQFSNSWTVSANYVYVHSWHLRTGGFSTTLWSRNFVPIGKDQFGRSILGGSIVTLPNPPNPPQTFAFFNKADSTLFSNNDLASFGRGNYHEFVAAVNKRFSRHYQLFGSYTWSRNYANASSERDSDSFFGPQDPFNVNLDYGRIGLDMTHQFKAGIVADLPMGFTWSSNYIYHTGVAFPAYIKEDINGDGVSNQGIGSDDRPTVQIGSGKPFLLPDYPLHQPDFFTWDMRLAKNFNFSERYQIRLSADLFNVTNRGNLISNPDVAGFIDVPGGAAACTPVNPATSVSIVCPPLTALPTPANQPGYRKLDQIAPGATPFAAQFGVRFQF